MTLNVLDLPSYISGMLGVSEAIGQIIAIAIIYILCILPILFFSRRLDFSVLVIFLFLGTLINVAIGWLPFFAIVIYILFLAIKTGSVLRDWLAG